MSDCVRAMVKGESIIVRNPYSTRPYQHLFEPLAAYLMIAMEQAEDKKYADYYNIGPRDEDCINTGVLADTFVKYWGSPANWKNMSEANAPHEAGSLSGMSTAPSERLWSGTRHGTPGRI